MIRFRAHRLKVREIVFSPCGRLLLTRGASEPEPALWDAATGELVRRYVRRDQILNGRPDRSELAGLRFSPDGHLFAAYDHGEIGVWRTDTEAEFDTLHEDIIFDRLAFHPVDGAIVARVATFKPWNSSPDQKTFLGWWYDPGTPRADGWPTGNDRMPSGGSGELEFSPDGHYLAVSHLRSVDLWRVEPWGRSATITFPGRLDDKFLRYRANLLIGIPAKVEVWTAGDDPPARLCQVTQRRHGNKSIASADLSPDGRTLLTAGTDGTAALWDVLSGKERTRFDWQLGRLSAAAASPDGTRWAVAGGGEVVVWDAE